MSTLKAELHALNDAAYSAAKAARKERDPRADALRKLALAIDDLIDQCPAPQIQESAE